MAMALWTLCNIVPGDNHLTAILAVPHRNSVSPPKLTGDTPVLDGLHPMEIGILPSLWIESDVALLPCINGFICHATHSYEPLL